MRHFITSTLLGLSAATVFIATPALAELNIYRATGGSEALRFNPDALERLSSLGLSLGPIESTAPDIEGYDFSIGVTATNYKFGFDPETGEYQTVVPFNETVDDFTGSFFFKVDTERLDLPELLEIGDFAVRGQTNPPGAFVIDRANTGLRVFDLAVSGRPRVDFENQNWIFEGIQVIFTEEFSNFLLDAGIEESTAGLVIAEARGDRSFVLDTPQSVPENNTVIPLGIVLGSVILLHKNRRRVTV